MELQTTIWHDGRRWILQGEGFKLSAHELDELDRKVIALVTKDQRFKKNKVKKIYMHFDMYTIPQWIRQYMQHYFSRILEV